MTPVDHRAQELWDEYTEYKEQMFNKTSTKKCPWVIIDSTNKREARISVIEYILGSIPYKKL